MELRTIWGDLIFALETAKTVLELVNAAAAAKKSLRGANLRGADLSGANLRGADLSGANLRGADLSGANLYGANLYGANLYGANLRGANLYGANLYGANLYGANLYGANLYGANLRGADLSGADLRGADLRGADLSGSNLRGADLSGADLSGADLRGADLKELKNAELTLARVQFIPETGAFEGWKKCADGVIVRLQIPKDAKRSHGTGRKCRASKVKVLEVIGATKGISLHDGVTEYIKGKTVTADKWDENRWETCSNGIHFYITRIEAENHQ